MRRALLLIAVLLVSAPAFAQNQQQVPRLRLSFDGDTTRSTGDFGGWFRWRTSAATPPVSAPGEGRIYFDGTNFRISENGSAYRIIGAGNGTVSSVGLAAAGVLFNVTGSPVTTSGTLTLNLNTQAANTFLAGPTSGAAATPTFRAFSQNDFATGLIPISSLNQSTCTTGAPIEWNGTSWGCGVDETTPGGNAWLTNGNALGATGTFGTTDNSEIQILLNNVQRGYWTSSGIFGFTHNAGANVMHLYPNTNATSTTTLVDSPSIAWTYRYWNGSANVDRSWSMWADGTAVTPTSQLNLMNPAGTSVFRVLDSGGIDINTALSSTRTGDNNIVAGTSVQQVSAGLINVIQRSTCPTVGGTETKLCADTGDDRLYVNEGGTGWVRVTGQAGLPAAYTYFQRTAADGISASTGGATLNVRNDHTIMEFSDGVTETLYFEGTMPEEYDGGSVAVYCRAVHVPTTGNVRWGMAWERISTTIQDIDADGFATALNVTAAVNATSGMSSEFSITFTNAQADAIAAGNGFRLRVQRIGADAADTAAGDAQLMRCQIRKP